MASRKKQAIQVGDQVRVADPTLPEPRRWTEARTGTVTSPPVAGGVTVLLEGNTRPLFFPWCDVDVAQKPRPGDGQPARLLDVPLIQILPSRWQYRTRFDADALLELAYSIKEHGLVNRLLVFRHEDGEHYELIAGERRLRACWALALGGTGANMSGAVQMAAAADWWDTVCSWDDTGEAAACELRAGDAETFREIVILENLQREDPSPLDEAAAFKALLDAGYTQKTLGKRLGKSQAYVSQRLGLLGLSEDVRGAVESQALSFSAARAVASLPEAVQPAVAAHVQKLAEREGESQATTRKVQALTRDVKRFLDPDAWQAPEGKVLEPDHRNRWRLLRWHVENLSEMVAGDAVIKLSSSTAWEEAYLRKRPSTIAESRHYTGKVVDALAGEDNGYHSADVQWPRAAEAQGWTCSSCQFLAAPVPAAGEDFPCARWAGEEVTTCWNYIGPDDPVVLPFYTYELREWARKVDAPLLDLNGGVRYADDFRVYAEVQEKIAALKAATEAERQRRQDVAHLVDLRSYWAAQADLASSPFDMGHGQAHGCRRCVHWQPDLQDGGLPPCRFAADPLRDAWDHIAAPAMGILVRGDGIMVPRCAQYRVREPRPLPPMVDFVLPDQPAVLEWLAGLIKVHATNVYDHNHTLPAPLAWLPYPRKEWKVALDLERLIRWLRDEWDGLGGDEGLARLLEIGLLEALACRKHHEPVELVDPASGARERWASAVWSAFADGQRGYSHYALPADWPRPWIREE